MALITNFNPINKSRCILHLHYNFKFNCFLLALIISKKKHVQLVLCQFIRLVVISSSSSYTACESQYSDSSVCFASLFVCSILSPISCYNCWLLCLQRTEKVYCDCASPMQIFLFDYWVLFSLTTITFFQVILTESTIMHLLDIGSMKEKNRFGI